MGASCSSCPCYPCYPCCPYIPIPSSPFSKTGMSKSNPLRLIQGYENEPLVSLEEALGPFHGKIPHLSNYIKEAKTKCYYPAKPILTRDESAAIYIYTMKWGNGCLYDHLQAAWESDDPLELKPWYKYLKLFKTAFDKLPDAKGEIWQGKSHDANLREELNSNSSSLYVAMDLFSPSKSFVQEFLHNRGIKEKILIGFKSVGGKLLGEYSAMNLNEVIVFPGTKLGLSDIDITSESGSVIYHMTGPFDEPIKKAPILEKQLEKQLEKHFVCCNDDHHCSISILLSIVFRNNSLSFMVDDITT